MLKIGIVGAENSHTVAIAKTINIDRLIPDAQVVGVWGETPEFAKDAATRGKIPDIVESPDDFIGQVDGVVVDHRHARYHLPSIQKVLEAKIPLFIDKPFCYRVDEGKQFLTRARELGVPICSFSVLPKQASFMALKKSINALGKLSAVVSTGPCDINSEHGGIFFYGIHQVDMLLRLVGYDPVNASVQQGTGDNHLASITFKSGTVVSMNLINTGRPAFHLSVIGEEGRIDEKITNDENSYLTGIQDFVEMFRTGKTDETYQTMLAPVAVLQALEEAVDTGQGVDVPSFEI